jgi:ribA/ribD-fused uncharacterized protein
MDDGRFLVDLRARVEAGETPEYFLFYGHRPTPGRVTASCLSQWYVAPFEAEGRRYTTAEQYMMAGKATLFGDFEALERILQAPDPRTAKALGRTVRGFDDATWKEHRFEIVVRGNLAKFGHDDAIRTFLLATGESVLVEASPTDRIWGIGLSRDDPRALDPRRWLGRNLLGFALMEARRQLLAD